MLSDFFPLYPYFTLHTNSQKKLLCKLDQFAGQLVTKSCCCEMLNVRARLAICYICDTSWHYVGCRTFQINKCRWKGKRRKKKKLSVCSSYAAAHLGFLSSSNVCLGVSQYAFPRLNFFLYLLSVAFIAATQKKPRNSLLKQLLHLSTTEPPKENQNK